MKHYLLIVGLLLALGLTAGAQTSPPIPGDPNNQPGVIPSTPPTFPTDTQAPAHPDADADSQSTAAQQAPADKVRTGHGSDYQSQLRTALQAKPNLAGVDATFTDTAVELSGTVSSAKDRMQARSIAESYANGRKVTDHITIVDKK